MADEQDQAENLDDDELDGAYPPDHTLGIRDAVSDAGTEPGAPESVADRAAREEPEEIPTEDYRTVGDPEEIVLDEGDVFAGDMTLRDVVQEREAPVPAEEDAIHVVDEDLGGFESDVDDPQLEAAWELDPEPER
jgi:hypothetical protein